MWEKEYVREQEAKPKSNRFSFWNRNKQQSLSKATPPPTVSGRKGATPRNSDDTDLPERVEKLSLDEKPKKSQEGASGTTQSQADDPTDGAKATAGFDFQAIAKVLQKEDLDPDKIKMPQPSKNPPPANAPPAIARSESVPIPATTESEITPTATPRLARTSLQDDSSEDTAPPRFTRSQSTTAAFSTFASPVDLPSVSSWSSQAWNPSHDLPTTRPRQPSFASAPSPPETLSFGSFDGSITSGYGPPSTTLSFGSADGGISSVSIADPWASDSRRAKDEPKKSWNANPWS
jgi:hypothetical protein